MHLSFYLSIYLSIYAFIQLSFSTKQSLLQMGFTHSQVDRAMMNSGGADDSSSKAGGYMGMTMEELLMILTLEEDEQGRHLDG